MTQQIAIVTGASSGLGLACVNLLVDKEIPTLMIARRAKVLKEKATSLQSDKKASIYTIAADVGSQTDVKKIFRFMEEEDLQVKWLINNAGVGRFGDYNTYSFDDIEITMRASLIGMILMSQTFMDALIENDGVLCNVMSTAALKTRPKETVYTAAKWGARGYTEALRAEVKGKSVRVMAVYPGGIDTPFWDENRHYVPDSSKFMPPLAVANRIISNIFDAENCQVNDITINRI